MPYYSLGAPNTTEELVQEAGRAGRDGNNAEAILFDIRRGPISQQDDEEIR